ncbi:uncharacterized protein CDAR_119491 [Caerostris darwini]|uniref:Uncharacterized protein n=1 Tax=Caerostris darwini TaxID=1538125 RepID=A0AAV4SCL9_9ARAC|nr:uncharacterized protein CDAR_119491 [Caerostris darwini]
MVQSVELALDPDADPTRVRSPAIDGAVQRTLHVHQHLHHRPDGMVSKIPMRSLNGLGGNVLSRAGHFGEYEVQNTEALDGSLICDDPLRY